MTDQTRQLEEIIRPVVESFGCTLWGVEFRPFRRSALLRVYIDRPEGGVTLDDCADVSYQLSGVLDVEDPIAVPYTLEVSSPGIERPLLDYTHYRRYVGERAKVRLKWPVAGSRNYRGIIRAADDERLTLETAEQVVDIPWDAIGRGRLLVDIQPGQSKQR